jgi:hypothetical protein
MCDLIRKCDVSVVRGVDGPLWQPLVNSISVILRWCKYATELSDNEIMSPMRSLLTRAYEDGSGIQITPNLRYYRVDIADGFSAVEVVTRFVEHLRLYIEETHFDRYHRAKRLLEIAAFEMKAGEHRQVTYLRDLEPTIKTALEPCMPPSVVFYLAPVVAAFLLHY